MHQRLAVASPVQCHSQIFLWAPLPPGRARRAVPPLTFGVVCVSVFMLPLLAVHALRFSLAIVNLCALERHTTEAANAKVQEYSAHKANWCTC